MNELVNDIASYLGYLNSSEIFKVTVHFNPDAFSSYPFEYFTPLLPYNVHTQSRCITVKRRDHKLCIAHQRDIISSEKGRSFVIGCHGGICEYVHRIFCGKTCVAYIAVGRCDGDTPSGDDMAYTCPAFVTPLAYMLEKLFAVPSSGDRDEYDMIVHYLHEYHNSVTLEELCARFGRSKSYISHMFSKKSGTNLRNYCNRLKLADAERMLAETDLSVTEISFDSGFGDVSYFISLFKKQYGMSPLRYRRIRCKK